MAWRSLLVFLVACGGSASGGGSVMPFIGVYTTMSHSRAEMPGSNVACSDPGQPVSDSSPYFRLDVDEVFMDPDVLGLSECSDAAGMSCVDRVVTLRAGGPGLQDDNANTQTGGGVMCQLYFTHTQAKLTGTTIEIEVLDKFDAPNISSSDCTLQRAQALSSSPDCRSVERWTGTRR